AWEDASAMPIGARAPIGGVELERFARLHAPMIELARALEAVGAEVWIVSASAQPIVEALAEIAGLRSDRVIGVRMPRREWSATEGEVIDHGFEPCGQGALETPVMTWHEGKRCWINRVIFERPIDRQRVRAEQAALRPVFAAGDSDGDLAMLQDATELRVVLDRHQPRVMCSALADPARWLVQPLFVDPPPPRSEPYPCARFADELGPVRDEHGRSIADQSPPRVDGSGTA
nr:haloacid dehalogenase-like hydrolase [Myxococcota bacterium]